MDIREAAREGDVSATLDELQHHLGKIGAALHEHKGDAVTLINNLYRLENDYVIGLQYLQRQGEIRDLRGRLEWFGSYLGKRQ